MARWLPAASDQKPQLDGIGLRGRYDCDTSEVVERTRQFAAARLHFGDAGDALVEALGILELHGSASAIAGLFRWITEGSAAGIEELLHAGGFTAVFLDANCLLAGPQAAIHFAIDAAGVLGGWLQVFFAAPDLEQVENLVVEVLGGAARGKGTIEQAPAESRGDHGAGELIVERETHESGRAKPHNTLPIVRKVLLRELQVDERRIELRAR